MSKVNKRDLVELIAEKAHLSIKDARAALDTAQDLIAESLIKGNEVNITNFGTFIPKVRPSRDGTDPKSHERITLKSAKTVTLKLSKSFKEELNK